jgi:hypothetical protein
MKTTEAKYKVSYLLIFLSFIATPFISLFIYGADFHIEEKIGYYPLTEIVTIFLLLILIYWYKKSSDIRKRMMVLSIVIGTSTALMVMYGQLLILFLNNSHSFTEQGYEKQIEFAHQQERYIPLITKIFDKAENTNVRSDIDQMYNSLLQMPYASEDINGKHIILAYTRRPVYFIRLKNGQIEKLFQSGNIKYELIDTDGEKLVQKMLLGKVPPIQYPQYTCCGGDDLSWSEAIPFFRLFVPERHYLKDFYSELETILLIKDNRDNILGAMVDLHGD